MHHLRFFFSLWSISFFFHSCQGQQCDVEKILLPVKQSDLQKLKLTTSGAGVGTETVQYSSYFSDEVDDGKIPLSFGGLEIKSAPPSEYHIQSIIRFYGKNKDDFEGFTLNIEDSESLQRVLKYLLNKKDKFKLVFDDGKDNEERARVFICEQNKMTYLVLSRINNKGKKIGYVEGISTNETPLLSSRLGGAFGYYKDYLEYRRHKPANFSYQDFLKETDNEFYKQNTNLH